MEIFKKNFLKLRPFFLISLFIVILLVLFPRVVFGINTISEGWKVLKYSSQVIDIWGSGKTVINNSPSDIFVPSKTATEWTTFVTNAPPAAVTLEDPVVRPCNGTGGTITRGAGNSCIHTFTSEGNFSLDTDLNVEVLVVAGGGGGGRGIYSGGGGGGGGGVVYNSSYSLSSGIHSVTIGAGGGPMSKGFNSSFGSLVAIGGGAGAGSGINGSSSAGGSGGGGCGASGVAYPPGPGTAGQGNSGSNSHEYFAAGGGGGGGSVGGSYSYGGWGCGAVGGAGGSGYLSSISGTATYYGGGGGGGSCGYGGAGGAGGGGAGGGLCPGGGASTPNISGTANTGGGGGGSKSQYWDTSSGGSGIVIIKYIPVYTPAASIPGGYYSEAQSVTLSADTGATIYYTTNGSTPTTGSTVYSGPISVGSTMTIKAFAYKNGSSSAVMSHTYNICSWPATENQMLNNPYRPAIYGGYSTAVFEGGMTFTTGSQALRITRLKLASNSTSLPNPPNFAFLRGAGCTGPNLASGTAADGINVYIDYVLNPNTSYCIGANRGQSNVDILRDAYGSKPSFPSVSGQITWTSNWTGSPVPATSATFYTTESYAGNSAFQSIITATCN